MTGRRLRREDLRSGYGQSAGVLKGLISLPELGSTPRPATKHPLGTPPAAAPQGTESKPGLLPTRGDDRAKGQGGQLLSCAEIGSHGQATRRPNNCRADGKPRGPVGTTRRPRDSGEKMKSSGRCPVGGVRSLRVRFLGGRLKSCARRAWRRGPPSRNFSRRLHPPSAAKGQGRHPRVGAPSYQHPVQFR